MTSQPHLVERAARQAHNPLLDDPVDGTPYGPPPLPPPAGPPPGASAPAGRATAEPLAPAPAPPAPVATIELEVMQKAGLAVFSGGRTRVMEEWRVTASTLLRRQPKRRPGDGGLANALMVTSSRAREGKSFCSLNLAATIASNRQAPTVLVDLDAKATALSRLLGLSEVLGLLDLMADPALPVAAVLVPTAVQNLHVLPLGGSASSSVREGEAGVSFPLITALQRVGRQLADRLLVFDTAPCLATSDASALAPSVGQIAMVVEAETTQKNDLDAALGLLAPCQLVSLVLNKVRNQTSGHFGVETYGYDGRDR